MSDRLQCGCGRFVGWKFDSGTVYGCASYNPPEPHDPSIFCPRCASELKAKEKLRLEQAAKEGRTKVPAQYWQSPAWYSEAVRETGWTREGHYLVRQ